MVDGGKGEWVKQCPGIARWPCTLSSRLNCAQPAPALLVGDCCPGQPDEEETVVDRTPCPTPLLIRIGSKICLGGPKYQCLAKKLSEEFGKRGESRFGQAWTEGREIGEGDMATVPPFRYTLTASPDGEVWDHTDDTHKFSTFGWRTTTTENAYNTQTRIGNWNERNFGLDEIQKQHQPKSQVCHHHVLFGTIILPRTTLQRYPGVQHIHTVPSIWGGADDKPSNSSPYQPPVFQRHLYSPGRSLYKIHTEIADGTFSLSTNLKYLLENSCLDRLAATAQNSFELHFSSILESHQMLGTDDFQWLLNFRKHCFVARKPIVTMDIVVLRLVPGRSDEEKFQYLIDHAADLGNLSNFLSHIGIHVNCNNITDPVPRVEVLTVEQAWKPLPLQYTNVPPVFSDSEVLFDNTVWSSHRIDALPVKNQNTVYFCLNCDRDWPSCRLKTHCGFKLVPVIGNEDAPPPSPVRDMPATREWPVVSLPIAVACSNARIIKLRYRLEPIYGYHFHEKRFRGRDILVGKKCLYVSKK
eukprot:sb/3463817/